MVVITEQASGVLVLPTPEPLEPSFVQATASTVLGAAQIIRIALTAILVTVLLAWLVILTTPHRGRTRVAPSALHLMLLMLLWLPLLLI